MSHQLVVARADHALVGERFWHDRVEQHLRRFHVALVFLVGADDFADVFVRLHQIVFRLAKVLEADEVYNDLEANFGRDVLPLVGVSYEKINFKLTLLRN